MGVTTREYWDNPVSPQDMGVRGPSIFSKPDVSRLTSQVLHICLLSSLTNVWHLLNHLGWQTYGSGGVESYGHLGTPL